VLFCRNHTYTHTHTHTQTHTHTYVLHTYTYTYVCRYVHTYVHTCICMYVCIHTHTNTHTHTCMYVYIYTHMYILMTWHPKAAAVWVMISYVSNVSIRQHTSAYVSIRQHTSAYVSIRQHTSAYVRMQHLASEGSGGVGDDCLRSSFYQSVGGARESPQRAPYCHLCHSRALTEP
jgi:hypothetical protein